MRVALFLTMTMLFGCGLNVRSGERASQTLDRASHADRVALDMSAMLEGMRRAHDDRRL